MTAARFVVLGLAAARSEWFPDVARWSTSGHLPLEFVKCVSTEDLRARASTGRRYSAALVDGALSGVDRDLLGELRDASIPPLVVAPAPERVDWVALGAAAKLEAPLSRSALHEALERHASPVHEVAHDLDHLAAPADDPGPLGLLVAVTGAPGSGRSTVALAAAQHLADRRPPGTVAVLDLARRAHLALLHDAGDLVPGIQELAEACRSDVVAARDLRPFTFDIAHRGYHVVLGLRRPRDWVTIRSRAFTTALESVGRAFEVVVADVDEDVEGEAETGSFDIEDRNLMARTALGRADVAVVVAHPTLTGLHGLVHDLLSLQAFGVPGARVLVAVNRAPRSPRARAELTRTIADLVGPGDCSPAYAGVVFVGDRRQLDLVHHDQARFPASVADPVGRAVDVLLQRNPPRDHGDRSEGVPIPVRPGSLGSWDESER